MKKNIFNGNIDKSCVTMVKVSLILLVVIFDACALIFFFGSLSYENIEPAAKTFMYILAGLSFIASIIYPLLTLFAIRTYPKHKRLAHLLLKEYVFETNNQVIISNCKEVIIENIISHIPSKEIKKYLMENKNKLSIMQCATLVENYCKRKKVAILEALRIVSDNEYEKELFTIAAKDYKKYKRIEKRTMDYFNNNDPRDKKPMCPFEEFIYLPTLFKVYDLALLLGDNSKIVIIGRSFNFEENDVEDNENYDFSDLSYLAYDLDTKFEIKKDNLIHIHVHAHYCELERFDKLKLNDEQLLKYEKIVALIKE